MKRLRITNPADKNGVSALGVGVEGNAPALGLAESADLAAGTAGALVDAAGLATEIAGTNAVNTVNPAGATETLSMAYRVHDVTLDVNVTLTFSGAPVAGIYAETTVILRQDGTGTNTLTFADNVLWSGGGVQPTVSTAGSKVSVWKFFTVDGGTTYWGYLLADQQE